MTYSELVWPLLSIQLTKERENAIQEVIFFFFFYIFKYSTEYKLILH